jgi:hypothetical protein
MRALLVPEGLLLLGAECGLHFGWGCGWGLPLLFSFPSTD